MRRRIFFVISLLVFGLVFMLTQLNQAQAQGNWVVIPGASVGPISLNMPVSKVESMLKRDPAGAHMIYQGRPVWIFYKEGVQVNYDGSGTAMQIYVDKPGIATQKGIQVGDSQARFISAYGTGYIAHELPTAKSLPKQYFYAYKKIGLGFQVEGDKVKFIAVFDKHN